MNELTSCQNILRAAVFLQSQEMKQQSHIQNKAACRPATASPTLKGPITFRIGHMLRLTSIL